jgi:hypothetical protein
MNRALPHALLAALLVACAANPAGEPGLVDDAGSARDRPVATMDRGRVPLPSDDLGAPPTDTPSTPPPTDVGSVYDTGPVRPTPDACVVSGAMCTPRPEACEARERCGNGLDDNCNGMVDEACPCIPGTVQDCFLGPPGRRGAGQCSGGTQRCLGTGEFGNWGACDGALAPSAEVCDNLDNDCDGCVDEGLCCNADLNCPGAGDVRVPEGRPFQAYPLRGRLFYPGEARAWRWTVRGGPCDAVLPRPTFQLVQADQRDAAFVPTLSGDYTVTLTVTTATGQTLTCTFVVHIAGPGVRVELCWDTSTTVDLDLYVHDPRNMGPWFDGAGSPISEHQQQLVQLVQLRGQHPRHPRARELGLRQLPPRGLRERAPRRRLAPTRSLRQPPPRHRQQPRQSQRRPREHERRRPRNAERFRMMVQNFSGRAARPLVNVYCGGRLRGTVGPMPGEPWDFTGPSGNTAVGAMWRVADVVSQVDGMGVTTGCEVVPLRAPGMTGGYFVTRNDPSY